jgi:SAM-dependent methyltransferase
MLRQALRRSVTVRKISKRIRRLDAPKDARFEDHYSDWRRKRIAAIADHYGPGFFNGKTVLEVGCGYGDIGAAFAAFGATVTCSDARDEHLQEAARRHPEVRVVAADLDGPWPFPRHDVLLHLGLLYHLADPEQAIRQALDAADHLVLETEVCDSSDPIVSRSTVEVGYDQAFNNHGCRPSPAFVERLLTESGRPFIRIEDDRCNTDYHRYDWPIKETGEFGHGLRRMWFVAPVR